MRKLLYLILVVPLAIVLILLSVANRHSVMFSIDPLNTDAPAYSFTMPFFVFIFAALIIGLVIGACLTWLSQGKHRRALREKSYEATRLQREYDKDHPELKGPAPEIAPGLPMVTSS